MKIAHESTLLATTTLNTAYRNIVDLTRVVIVMSIDYWSAGCRLFRVRHRHALVRK